MIESESVERWEYCKRVCTPAEQSDTALLGNTSDEHDDTGSIYSYTGQTRRHSLREITSEVCEQ